MRKLIAVLLSTAAVVAWAGPAWWKGTLTIDKDWLGKDVLFPHEFAILTGLECADYDIKLVDDEGDVCIVEDVDFCLQDAHWHLTNKELASCSGFEKEATFSLASMA